MRKRTLLPPLMIAVLIALLISGIRPYERLTWLLETLPVMLAAPLLLATYRRFPLSSLLYVLLALHAGVLMLGGTYTYARVPLGYWLQDLFELSRNPYDRIGHLMQGITPALLAREYLLHQVDWRGRQLLAVLSVCVALAFSAFYELIEWWVAVLIGQDAEAFLGTQGDIWDTQWDMCMALLGASLSVLCLGPLQDRQLRGSA